MQCLKQRKQYGQTTKLIMMQYNKPYSFEKTDVRWLFLLKFSTTNVKLETVCPIAANGQLIGEGREIVARLPNHLQKFNSATKVQNIFFTPAFRQ